ncbi:hypothetical protein HK105_203240 [Polyrhizophydium stewartii]|uniref:histidine kinase n=1 Tax=Polyrhizophydium stewartii TaxID=2732419 RepID=A0ABR4NCL2_9FUNG
MMTRETSDDGLLGGGQPLPAFTSEHDASCAPLTIQAHGFLVALASPVPVPQPPCVASWTITHLSMSLEPLLGHKPQALLGQPISRLIAAHHHLRLESDIEGFGPSVAADDSIQTTVLDVVDSHGNSVACYCALHWDEATLILELETVDDCDRAVCAPPLPSPAPTLDGLVSPLQRGLGSMPPPVPPAAEAAGDASRYATPPPPARPLAAGGAAGVGLPPLSVSSADLLLPFMSHLPHEDETVVRVGSAAVRLPPASSHFFDSPIRVMELLSATKSALEELSLLKQRSELVARILLHLTQFEHLKITQFDESDPDIVHVEDIELHSTCEQTAASASVMILPKFGIARHLWDRNLLRRPRTRLMCDVNGPTSPVLWLPHVRQLVPDHCMLLPCLPIHTEYLRSSGMVAMISARIHCFGKLWGSLVLLASTPRRLPFRLMQFISLITSTFSKFVERQTLQEQWQHQQHLTDRTLQHVVAGPNESARRSAALAKIAAETGASGSSAAVGGSAEQGLDPLESKHGSMSGRRLSTDSDQGSSVSNIEIASQISAPLAAALSSGSSSLTSPGSQAESTVRHESLHTRHSRDLMGQQSNSAIFDLPIESLQNADPAIHANAVQEAAGYLVSCVGDLLTFFNADAAVFCVNSDKRVIGPAELNQELINAMRYLENKQIRFIMASCNLRRDFELAFCDSQQTEPVFKELAGLLHIPLSATGDAFISFFRLPREDDSDDESEISGLSGGEAIERLARREALAEHKAEQRAREEPLVAAPRAGLFDSEHDLEEMASSPWTSHDENVARLLQVLYWWFISVYQEREMAMQNDRLKNLMLTNISREVRAPLNSIINLLELMDEEGGQGSEGNLKEYLQQAQEASQSLVHIINDLLFLTQIDAGKMILRSESFMLRSCLHSTVQSFQSLANKKDLQLALNIDPQLENEKIQGDSSKLRQIVAILCDNAVAYTERGRIRASCVLLQKNDELISIQFDLEDTGIGIPKEKLRLIQEDIAHCRMSRQAGVEGAGLGLAILARLLKQLKGRLSIRTKPGQGSTFSVQLSFLRSTYDQEKRRLEAKMSAIKTINTESLRKPTNSAEINVLVVDDNHVNQQVLLRRLGKDGHSVTFASSGEEALAIFKQRTLAALDAGEEQPTRNESRTEDHPRDSPAKQRKGAASDASAPFDLVLMDVQMPGWSGNDTARQMRAFEREHGIDPVPIFGVSGAIHSSDQDACRASGMSGFVVKPVDVRILRSIVSDVAVDQKKDDFRKYLERNGVIDALTKVLVGLFEEPEKPESPIDHIKMLLGGPSDVDTDALRRENDDLRRKVDELQARIDELTSGMPQQPADAAAPATDAAPAK